MSIKAAAAALTHMYVEHTCSTTVESSYGLNSRNQDAEMFFFFVFQKVSSRAAESEIVQLFAYHFSAHTLEHYWHFMMQDGDIALLKV